MKAICLLVISGVLAFGQSGTTIFGGRTILGQFDASAAVKTAPNRVGASDPPTCDANTRETFFNTSTNTLKVCTAANMWTATGGAGAFRMDTAGLGYFFPFGYAPSNQGTLVSVANRHTLHQFVLPYGITAGKLIFEVTTPSGTGCPGGVCGLRFTVWDSTCTNRLGETDALTSGGSPNINATGFYSAAFHNLGGSSPVSMEPGIYYLASTTDSIVLGVRLIDSLTLLGTMNKVASIGGAASNPSSGNGASIAFPATCGAILPGSTDSARPAMVLLAR